jgi:hypothetical protein
MIFATPDFGAGGAIVLVLLVICLFVLTVTVLGIVCGANLVRRPSRGSRRVGWALVLVGVLLPVVCFCGPSVLFRLNHDNPPLGHYPNGVIQEGMSADEVRALLGNPHEVSERDRERVGWWYWLDAIELDWFLVTFGPDGKVTSTSGS